MLSPFEKMTELYGDLSPHLKFIRKTTLIILGNGVVSGMTNLLRRTDVFSPLLHRETIVRGICFRVKTAPFKRGLLLNRLINSAFV